ncbi:lipopolysaccharide transport periplasmic protein LptA [Salmonella enterica]|nr:lipopolysaccharide transport periplasmic protein LptA [Salmonella enterica subsp. enterica serovar Orientalis]EBJ4008359.1 lipopolysaccharide transport periplasmic protein LptA [Salmonella enterica]EBQ9235391.1 lipopolysaccharide transport periplasmic protein LptA [Salmonella enterica subsp. enterica serovar Orientalis]EKA1666408.1 lipopolysaccharide transport periplasmic protein LptA [Salmonella enterica]
MNMKLFFFVCMLTGIMSVTEIVYGAGISSHYVIHSDRQILLPDGNIRATGHVHVVSGDMTVDADEATYYREVADNPYLTASGNPVRYNGMTEDGRPFTGRSARLKYNTATGDVTFTGEAFVQQGGNTLSAPAIIYNIHTRKVTASGTGGERVRSVIYPAQVSGGQK